MPHFSQSNVRYFCRTYQCNCLLMWHGQDQRRTPLALVSLIGMGFVRLLFKVLQQTTLNHCFKWRARRSSLDLVLPMRAAAASKLNNGSFLTTYMYEITVNEPLTQEVYVSQQQKNNNFHCFFQILFGILISIFLTSL